MKHIKKLLLLCVAAALACSLTACGKDSGSKVSDSNAAPVSSEVDPDTALIQESQKKLTGSWVVRNLDIEQLTFNSDGTGTYKGIFDKDCTFTYTVSAYHQVYNNGDEKVIPLMHVQFSTGEVEDITFVIREDEGNKLVFTNSDYTGGYHDGVFNFDEYIPA